MSSHRHGPRTLRIIAVFKFVKVALLVLLAIELFRLRRPDESAHLVAWLHALPIRSGHQLVGHAIEGILGMSARTIDLFSGIALGYAALYSVEGVGLWRHARWAEYLTVIATSLFIPVELWEIAARFSAMKVLALAINVAIVAYLVRLLREQRRVEAGRAAAARSPTDSSTVRP
jgi:uncharacterized membrane protein (DUF2068 family)